MPLVKAIGITTAERTYFYCRRETVGSFENMG